MWLVPLILTSNTHTTQYNNIIMTNNFLLRFLPALLVLPIWLTIVLRENLLLQALQQYYPLSIAMIFGSLIAGSTPLGGGVVAFPVSVLIIQFTPSQGRDFSLMIQSCGMTAASYLVMITRPTLLSVHGILLAKTIFFNIMGLIVGDFVIMPPFIVMCVYTTSVASFAIILAYIERCNNRKRVVVRRKKESTFTRSSTALTQLAAQHNNSMFISEERSDDIEEIASCNTSSSIEGGGGEGENAQGKSVSLQMLIVDWILIALFSFIGGFISSQIGTGAEMAVYAYGALVHNNYSRRIDINNNKISVEDNDLTAMSIIVMTVTSIFGTILRASSSGDGAISNEVYHAFLACAWIVVLGAPVGSLFLSVNNQRRLRVLFYFLALLQLVIFGLIKFRDNAAAWCSVIGSLCLVMVGITTFDWYVNRRSVI